MASAEILSTLKRLDLVWNHIEEVRRNAHTLAERLIEAGEEDLGLHLIRNVMVHDQSKLSGIEWDNLGHTEADNCKEKLALAISNHNRTNPHHPEYWGSIKKMPPVYVAEMVCDWRARSNEFGTSLQEWIEKGSTKRYKFTKRDHIYKEIQRFLKLLLEPPFEKTP